ncbi:phage tail tube protein [Swaminathania salitolerans]|uniref:Phage tail protein n=1 Tax=Swaminathania salitolerans TaxID=182838 RepID=A0A511BNH0_9PROT|nr:phage tail tube protein [Swaminathania salitolerans]GBQ14737.1 phage minor tail protein [Swaminathania salitolerans LMG 21291]GEL01871.1 hypothetical protein SSA02_10340 [Swaminathania salitolerans]
MPYTGTTANYAAAAQSNASTVSYAKETLFALNPGGAFQRLRFTGESFRRNDSRQRPEEINLLSEVSQGVTTQESVSGTLSGAFSAGTYDDFLAAILGGDWQEDGALINGDLVKTWSLVQKIGDGHLLRPGAFCTRAQIGFPQGGFANVSFDFTCSRQEKSVSDPAGSYLAAPDGPVFDTIGNLGELRLGGEVPEGALRELTLTLARDGAESDYGLGSAASVGIRPGQFMATGQVQLFFRDWSLYDRFEIGWSGRIEIDLRDRNGRGYRFIFLNASLQNPEINAGARNTSIVATFAIEGNPQPGGGTFRIERLTP